jgi:hypothetical protein
MKNGRRGMTDRKGKDWVQTLGTVLVGVGVSMWIIYAVGRYLLGWNITDREFLPYHLATILPGMILRYHHFFFEDLPRRFSRDKGKAAHADTGMELAENKGMFFKALVVVNNFVHDLFTGLWASSILVIYLLDRKTHSVEGSLISPALHDVMRTFFWLGIASIALILATGGARLLYYRTEVIGGDREIKRTLLIVKHVLFMFVFIGGTYYAYLQAFSPK